MELSTVVEFSERNNKAKILYGNGSSETHKEDDSDSRVHMARNAEEAKG